MVDLTTTYMGLQLKNPLIASASPLSEKVSTIKKMEEAGVSAVVIYSLFEEQIIRESLEMDHYLTYAEMAAEPASFTPDFGLYNIGPEAYLRHISRVKEAVKIPVIGSLNGVSSSGWIDYAEKIEKAGADALELNIYYLSFDPDQTSVELEENYVKLVSDIRSRISIPLAVKLSPFFTSLANFARRLVSVGANSLVLFNRFYQPDIDLESLEVVPNLVLSTSHELRLPLRWIALLYGQVQTDFALTSGVHTTEDILKGLMCGASVTMVASEFLKNGTHRAEEMLDEMQRWMETHEYQSVKQMIGSMSARSLGTSSALKRANYMKELSSYKLLP